jgi:hypothetical protein
LAVEFDVIGEQITAGLRFQLAAMRAQAVDRDLVHRVFQRLLSSCAGAKRGECDGNIVIDQCMQAECQCRQVFDAAEMGQLSDFGITGNQAVDRRM